MAYTPNFEYDLFFSYAAVDNVEQLPGRPETRWVSFFRDCLVRAIERKLGRQGLVRWFFDKKDLESNAPLTPELQAALDNSAVFVAINSPSYLHPDCWCKIERQRFLQRLGRTPEERAKQRRVWIAHMDKVPRNEWQAAFFPDLCGADFFIEDADTGQVLSIPRENQYQPFLDRITRMAAEIANRLKVMAANPFPSSPALPFSPPQSPDKLSIFLAEVTPDLYDENDRLRVFLSESGWHVLPNRDYSLERYREEVKWDLSVCKAFVQLIGPHPWKHLP